MQPFRIRRYRPDIFGMLKWVAGTPDTPCTLSTILIQCARLRSTPSLKHRELAHCRIGATPLVLCYVVWGVYVQITLRFGEPTRSPSDRSTRHIVADIRNTCPLRGNRILAYATSGRVSNPPSMHALAGAYLSTVPRTSKSPACPLAKRSLPDSYTEID